MMNLSQEMSCLQCISRHNKSSIELNPRQIHYFSHQFLKMTLISAVKTRRPARHPLKWDVVQVSHLLLPLSRSACMLLVYIYFAVHHNEVRKQVLCLTNPRMTVMPKYNRVLVILILKELHGLSLSPQASTFNFFLHVCSSRGARTNGTVQVLVFHGHQSESKEENCRAANYQT